MRGEREYSVCDLYMVHMVGMERIWAVLSGRQSDFCPMRHDLPERIYESAVVV